LISRLVELTNLYSRLPSSNFFPRKSYSWRHNALNFYDRLCRLRIRCSLTRIKPNKPHSKFLGWFTSRVTSHHPFPSIFNEATYYMYKLVSSTKLDWHHTWASAIYSLNWKLLGNNLKNANVRFKKYCTNLDARRRIRHIRPNEALAPSSLVPQIMRSCAKNVFLHSVCR
jgi:hypothetical protein